MDTLLLANITGQYQRLDIFEDIPITLTIQQSDLTDLTGRRTPYSKTITLPDTAVNAQLFEHYYEVNGIDFNPLNQIPIVVQYRGTDIFSGVMRLNAVIQTIDGRLYEVYILGEVADWASQIRPLEIQDLVWSQYTHELSYSAVTTSWTADHNGNGLFNGDILYPLINYGLDYPSTSSAATPSFTYSFGEDTSFDQSANAVPIKMFKPAIRLKAVLDNILAVTDYTVISEFFNSDYFKSIYIDTFQNGKIGIESASAVTNQNIFRATSNDKSYRYTKAAEWTGDALKLFNLNLFSPFAYDPLKNFYFAEDGYFAVPYQGDYFWNLRFNYKTADPFFISGAFRMVVFKSTDRNNISGGTRIFESQEFNLSAGVLSQVPVNLFFSGTCSPGDFISVYLEETDFPVYFPSLASNRGQYNILPFSDGGVSDVRIGWDLYNSPALSGEQLVDIKLGIVNLNCFDFIKSLITMFNLVIIQDEPNKTITIEPYNWYYNDEDREVKDWTQKLDLNSPYRLEPLSFDLSKEVIWNYEYADFEFLPKQWYDSKDYVYGRYLFNTVNNVFSGQQEYVLPFGSCPTSGVTGAPNFIIPQFYYLNNQQQAPYATIPHMFFWTGNRLAYKDQFKTVQGSWYLLSGSTPVEWTTYPAVSHLSTLDSQLSTVISDLNFTFSFDFFGNTNTYINQFTPFTLYNTFWEEYINTIYSPETRRLTGRFFFRPLDVYETSINDKIYIKDAYYSIEKISDANLVNKTLTEISLIKNITPFYKVEPPAPFYFTTPNEGYPGPELAFSTLVYSSTNQTLVCNETAPVITVITFGSPTIQTYSEVYYDTGISYAPLPIGTYIKQQTIPGADTFVVVDIYGHILPVDC